MIQRAVLGLSEWRHSDDNFERSSNDILSIFDLVADQKVIHKIHNFDEVISSFMNSA